MSILRDSFLNIGGWLRSPEFALIALNGGCELTVRDRLLLPIQQDNPLYRVWSEHNRVDIALLHEGEPAWIAELKHNFASQPKEIFGRMESDVRKRSGYKCHKEFAHMITTIVDGPVERKYPGVQLSYSEQREYFSTIADAHLCFESELTAPYPVQIRLDVWIKWRPS